MRKIEYEFSELDNKSRRNFLLFRLCWAQEENNHKIERLIMSCCITKAVCFLFICMIMCVMMYTTLYMDMLLFFPSHIIFLLLFGICIYFVDFFYTLSWYKCNKNSVCYLWNSFNQLLKCCVYPSPKLRHRKRGLDFLIWVSDHVKIISMQIRTTHADHDKVAEYEAQSYRWHGFQSIFGPKPVKDDTYTVHMRLGFVSKMKMGNKMKKKGWGMEINGNKWMWKIEQKMNVKNRKKNGEPKKSHVKIYTSK